MGFSIKGSVALVVLVFNCVLTGKVTINGFWLMGRKPAPENSISNDDEFLCSECWRNIVYHTVTNCKFMLLITTRF